MPSPSFNRVKFGILILCLPVLYGNGTYCAAQSGRNSDKEIISQISNNLPVENQNWGISRNPENGFVYFANSKGLVEYNGLSTRVYPMPYGQNVRSVHVTASGKIFTGSFEEFGLWEDSPVNGLVYKSLSEKGGIEKNDDIWKIYDSGDTIFFQSFTTIYCYANDKVEKVKAPYTMLFMFRAGDGFITQILGNGLFRFRNEIFSFIDGSHLFDWLKIHSILKMPDGKLWICTANNGIYLYDGSKFKYLDTEISHFLTYQTCNGGTAISDSLFAFGTISDGVVFCNSEGKITRRYNYVNGLKNNTVLSLFLDNEHGLWIGLDDGANYLNLLSASVQYTNSTGNLGTIYSVLYVNHKLYMGTNHGLFEADIVSDNDDFDVVNVRLVPYSQGQVWTIDQFDNQVLCGHNDGTFSIQNNSLKIISDITGGWTLRKYNDLLIEGTYTGIIFFRKDSNGNWKFRNKIRGFSEPTRHIEVDYLGYIWASHPQKGVFKLEINESLDSVVKTQYFNKISDVPKHLDVCKINNQIVFTTSDSIYKFDYDRKSIVPFTILNQSLQDYRASSQVIPEGKNTYWFIQGNKIALFEISKDFEAVRLFEFVQRYTDLPGRELHVLHLTDNIVLIPTRQAFTIYKLERLKMGRELSQLRISKLVFRDKNGTMRAVDINSSEDIPYNFNNLTAYFSDPSNFDKPDKEYFYHLSNIDNNWHRTSSDNFSYLNLSPGKYKLLIKSEINDKPIETSFIIGRPWYISYPALIIYFFIFSGTLFLTFHIFRIELRKQKKLIEFEVRNTRLATELDSKSYELMLTMRYLVEKNETLSDLQGIISRLKEGSYKVPQKFVNEMEKIITNGLDSHTQEWKTAMNTLKLSQQGFFKKLMERHPELTPNDLRLCSYLRMNFTTKEIARLLNISGRAVEISRYRLRRKMNLEHDINLTEYLIRESEGDS